MYDLTILRIVEVWNKGWKISQLFCKTSCLYTVPATQAPFLTMCSSLLTDLQKVMNVFVDY